MAGDFEDGSTTKAILETFQVVLPFQIYLQETDTSILVSTQGSFFLARNIVLASIMYFHFRSPWNMTREMA